MATDRLLIVDWPVWVLPGLGSLQRAGGEVPRPQRQFSATHTRAPRRGGKRWRGGGWCKGTQDTAEKGGGGEELGDFRKLENVLCVAIIFYMKFDLRIYRGRANIRTLATALQCRLWGPQISKFNVYSSAKSQLLHLFDNYKFTLYPFHSLLCPGSPSLFILSSLSLSPLHSPLFL